MLLFSITICLCDQKFSQSISPEQFKEGKGVASSGCKARSPHYFCNPLASGHFDFDLSMIGDSAGFPLHHCCDFVHLDPDQNRLNHPDHPVLYQNRHWVYQAEGQLQPFF